MGDFAILRTEVFLRGEDCDLRFFLRDDGTLESASRGNKFMRGPVISQVAPGI